MSIGSELAAKGWRQAWVADTEYQVEDGDLPDVHCVCAYDLISRQRREVWVEPGMPCPFDMTADVLFIFFEADADVLAFISAGWPAPLNILDPRVIWKKLDNGAREIGPDGKKKYYGLYEAGDMLGLPHLPRALKDACRDLAIRGGPFTEEEHQVLILYCRTDVDLTARLFEKLWDFAGLEEPRAFSQALIDGRYMAAAARCYRNGLPVSTSRPIGVFFTARPRFVSGSFETAGSASWCTRPMGRLATPCSADSCAPMICLMIGL
jgi:DNA polymerase I